MDAALFKSATTSRGLTYAYYASPARSGQPTLLFLHGFGSTAAREWRHVVPYFAGKGYGVIALDLLGYGGTDKPTDVNAYVGSAMSRDVADVLDKEGIDKVIVVGYDWGAKLASRLANWCPERVLAYAFLDIPYWKPFTGTFEDVLAEQKAKVGYELFGYWYWFSEDDIDAVLQANMDAFAHIIFPYTQEIWPTKFSPVGALKDTVLSGFKSPLPPYITADDLEAWKVTNATSGWTASMCWYKVMVSGLDFKDDANIPPTNLYPPQTAPIFFGACTRDPLLQAGIGHDAMDDAAFKAHTITRHDFDADHWLMYSNAGEVCVELDRWLEGVVKA